MTRLAELLAALSLATDLGRGLPLEKALRTTLAALRIAEAHGLDDAERAAVYYAALLHPAGCSAFTHEAARTFGTSEHVGLPAFLRVDDSRPSEALGAVVASLHGAPPVARVRGFVKNMTTGKAFAKFAIAADCEAVSRFAVRFGLSKSVERAAAHVYERWDGKGGPAGLRGENVDVGGRVVALANQVEIFARTDGRAEAVAMARRRSGGWFDPACVASFERCADALFDELEAGSVWDAVLDAEPGSRVTVSERGLDEIAEGFADFADLKSPYLLGHSRGVATLAEAAGRVAGLADTDVASLRRAGLVHDVGRVAVSNLVWDKPGPLSPSDWEQVRLHAYHTERILSRAAGLAGLAALAGMHHERLDGSGYHRGVTAASLSRPARILAAADAYRAMTEDRPHRPARSPSDAVAEIEAMVKAGTLDADAAAAVCEAAGTAMRRAAATRPGGLTEREIDVLRLLAKGMSKKQIAKALFIAPGTVHTHTARIYEKLGVSTRAGVALFAMEHGLIEA